jgi:hypothetical protein
VLRRIAVLSFSALLALFTTQAQQQPSQEPPKQQAAASQSATFGQSLRKSVGFLTVKYLKGGVNMQSSGTCFFVFYEDKRLGEKQGFKYLVTNRHMAVPGVEKGESYAIPTSVCEAKPAQPCCGPGIRGD